MTTGFGEDFHPYSDFQLGDLPGKWLCTNIGMLARVSVLVQWHSSPEDVRFKHNTRVVLQGTLLWNDRTFGET